MPGDDWLQAGNKLAIACFRGVIPHFVHVLRCLVCDGVL